MDLSAPPQPLTPVLQRDPVTMLWQIRLAGLVLTLLWDAMGLALVLISTGKHDSLTNCPWKLQLFGGVAEYRSHWAWGAPDGGSGKCFPGGHASAALAFLAVPLSLSK